MVSSNIVSFISRRLQLPAISYQQRFFANDKKESLFHQKESPAAASPSNVSNDKNDTPELQRSLHSQYKERIQSSRVGRAADASSGVKPTISQKYFLVLTLLFKSSSDIPEYVPNQTMKRMHDRMRVISMFTAVALVYIIVYSSEFRTGRQVIDDKASGKVVKTYADIKS